MLERELCTGCSLCAAICPVHAITMRVDNYGASYPEVEEKTCIHCGLCETRCPTWQIEHGRKGTAQILEVWAAQLREESLRRESSSGGVFTALAQQVLQHDGAVIGCAMSENCREALHIVIERVEDLQRLRGSKYLQSSMGNILQATQALLRTGRPVLFSGTPCQVAALDSLLGEKRPENLWMVDFICHGVPLPGLWRRYLEEQEHKQGAPVREAHFRYKGNGWKIFSLRLCFADGQSYVGRVTEDPYLRGFISNCYLRPSCHHCKIRADQYRSDLTVADFWGVEKNHPDWNDDAGTSLVVVHTEKGREALRQAAPALRVLPLDKEDALRENPSYYHCVAPNPLRCKVMNELETQPFDRVIKRYYGSTIMAKIRRRFWGKMLQHYRVVQK